MVECLMPSAPLAATNCPCGSVKSYAACCGPFIAGTAPAPTAEALMRSRYTAYARAEIPYLRATLAPEAQDAFDEEAARRWATGSQWLGLTILATEAGSAADREGTVTFVARYIQDGAQREHRELAAFRRHPKTGAWYFADARTPKSPPVVREAAKVGRNDPCSCGSGKKHKKCCG